MKYLIYFLLCFIQPICLPVPELTTYLYGQNSIGEVPAFIIGLIGIMLGIITMYLTSKRASDYIIKKFHYEKKIEKLADYVKRYQILILGILFIIPVLPDEIICIGSPVIGISFIPFVILAFISKSIAIAMVVFSKTFADKLHINQVMVIVLEIVIYLIATLIFNIIDKKRKMKNE